MIEDGIDNTVSYRLGNDLLCLLDAFQGEFFRNILDGYFGVADINLFQAELDNRVSEPLNQS